MNVEKKNRKKQNLVCDSYTKSNNQPDEEQDEKRTRFEWHMWFFLWKNEWNGQNQMNNEITLCSIGKYTEGLGGKMELPQTTRRWFRVS